MGIDSGLFLQVFILFVLVGINAFFASSEIAIISLNDNKIRKMAEEGHKKASLIQNLIKEPSQFFATIQVGVTLSGLLASAFAAESFADRLSVVIGRAGLPISGPVIKTVSVIVITFFLSYFTLVFGELVPKRVAMQNPEPISMFSIKPLHFLLRIASPFVKFLTLSTNFIIKLFGGDPTVNEESVTEEEIRMMVDLGQERGVIKEAEKEMIVNVFDFDNTFVSEIMTHRKYIVSISIDSTMKEIMATIQNEKYTRIPVYQDTIDNIVGILHVRDLLHYMIKNGLDDSFSLKEIIRKPYYVPESKKIDRLFRELQRNKTHMAVVIDEYGGTAGIVTIEDLLEEIVGNIFDEYDEEEKEFEKLDQNTYMMKGTAELDMVQDLLEVKLPIDDYDTLSGFIIGQLGKIPGEKEHPVVEFNGVVFKVQEVNEKMISKVKVCKSE